MIDCDKSIERKDSGKSYEEERCKEREDRQE